MHDPLDVDSALAGSEVAGWEGKDSAPFDVSGTSPSAISEIRHGFLIRYHVDRLGADRCVDAIWPDPGHGEFHVDVNECQRYARP